VALGARPALVASLLAGVPACLHGQSVPRPIQDNSFLIEEAYNQDRNVVQHISSLTLGRAGGWIFNFTDEWPIGGPQDQGSIGATVLNDSGSSSLSVLAFNYRRQVVGGVDDPVAVAPRLSALVGFGESGDQSGGGVAVQAMIPVTTVLSSAFVAHWNLGVTAGAGPTILNAGASAVWLTLPWMNFLVEALYLGVDGKEATWLVSPGVRWAINVGSVQVVPGVALPVGLTGGQNSGVLLYLSVEHPFGPTEGK